MASSFRVSSCQRSREVEAALRAELAGVEAAAARLRAQLEESQLEAAGLREEVEASQDDAANLRAEISRVGIENVVCVFSVSV